ncbi:MAG TPA: endonuclease III, partial [Miltoncostaeaceae bacterium]|nr:endonuclease III [Miltoncostaeaceae bacterium]
RARAVAARLAEAYPEYRVPLDHASAFQLLAATILSAQCTDAMVNRVTPGLFARHPDARTMAEADVAELEDLIRPTGFFRSKARALTGMSLALVDRFGGEVPGRMGDLVTLPGVGRKTANVVLGHWFGVPGIAVDTHVLRLSARLGLTGETDPVRVERDLADLWPRRDWTDTSMRLILHGRRVCLARSPRCGECVLADVCPSARTAPATAPRAGRVAAGDPGPAGEDGPDPPGRGGAPAA